MELGHEVLLGAITMEDMDLVLDLVLRPQLQSVDVNPESPNIPIGGLAQVGEERELCFSHFCVCTKIPVQFSLDGSRKSRSARSPILWAAKSSGSCRLISRNSFLACSKHPS